MAVLLLVLPFLVQEADAFTGTISPYSGITLPDLHDGVIPNNDEWGNAFLLNLDGKGACEWQFLGGTWLGNNVCRVNNLVIGPSEFWRIERGITLQTNNLVVYGNVQNFGTILIPESSNSLTIAGCHLIIDHGFLNFETKFCGATLTNHGTITNRGTLTLHDGANLVNHGYLLNQQKIFQTPIPVITNSIILQAFDPHKLKVSKITNHGLIDNVQAARIVTGNYQSGFLEVFFLTTFRNFISVDGPKMINHGVINNHGSIATNLPGVLQFLIFPSPVLVNSGTINNKEIGSISFVGSQFANCKSVINEGGLFFQSNSRIVNNDFPTFIDIPDWLTVEDILEDVVPVDCAGKKAILINWGDIFVQDNSKVIINDKATLVNMAGGEIHLQHQLAYLSNLQGGTLNNNGLIELKASRAEGARGSLVNIGILVNTDKIEISSNDRLSNHANPGAKGSGSNDVGGTIINTCGGTISGSVENGGSFIPIGTVKELPTCNVTWDGNSDGDGDNSNWHDPFNWRDEILPHPKAIVTIDGNAGVNSRVILDKPVLTLRTNVEPFDSFSETLTIAKGDKLEIASNGILDIRTINNSGEIKIFGTLLIQPKINIVASGKVIIIPATTVTNSGTILFHSNQVNNGVIENSGKIFNEAVFTNNGIVNNSGTLTNQKSGQIIGTGTITATIPRTHALDLVSAKDVVCIVKKSTTVASDSSLI